MEKTEKIYETRTYRGVFFDIKNSNICSLRYGIYFYFCSKGMKDHFEKYLDSYIAKSKKRIRSVIPSVGIENIDIALAIEYYKIVEKRGYRIETFNKVPVVKAHLIGDVEFEEAKEEKEEG